MERDQTLRTITFVVPGLRGVAEAADLSNTLTGLSGVAEVDVDIASHTLSIRYDPDYSHPSVIEGNIVGAGYVLDGHGRTR